MHTYYLITSDHIYLWYYFQCPQGFLIDFYIISTANMGIHFCGGLCMIRLSIQTTSEMDNGKSIITTQKAGSGTRFLRENSMREKSRGGEKIQYNLRNTRITVILCAMLSAGLLGLGEDPPLSLEKRGYICSTALHASEWMIQT